MIYAKSGQTDRAIDAWQKAVQDDRHQYDALYNLAIVAAGAAGTTWPGSAETFHRHGATAAIRRRYRQRPGAAGTVGRVSCAPAELLSVLLPSATNGGGHDYVVRGSEDDGIEKRILSPTHEVRASSEIATKSAHIPGAIVPVCRPSERAPAAVAACRSLGPVRPDSSRRTPLDSVRSR